MKKLFTFLLFCFLFVDANAQVPTNIGFENGDLQDWATFTGINPSCCPLTATFIGVNNQIPGKIEIVSGSGNDFYSGLPQVCPISSNFYALKLGSDSLLGKVDLVRTQFLINYSDTLITFSYATVLQLAGHAPNQEPQFEIKIFDGGPTANPYTTTIDVTSSVPTSGSTPSYFYNATYTNVQCSNWTVLTLHMSSLLGHVIILQFGTSDCSFLTHFGYAYIDYLGNSSATFYANAGGNKNVCQNSSTQIIANTIGGTAPYHYQWSPSLGLSNDTISNPIASPSVTTTYTLTITEANMNVSIDSMVVNVFSQSSNSFSHSICNTDSFLFKGIYLHNAGIYFDTLTNYSGCDSIIMLNLNVLPRPDSTFTVINNLCSPFTSCISATANYWNLGTTYTWYFNGGFVNGGSSQGPYYVCYPNNNIFSRIITLVVTNNGCISLPWSDTVYFHHLKAGFALPTAVCIPQPVSFTDSSAILSNDTSLTYQWDFNDGSPVNTSKNPTHIFSVAGNYNVQLIVQNNFGCTDTITKSLQAIYSFNITNQNICSNQTYFFNGFNLNSTGAYFDTLINFLGCDSMLTLNLIVDTPITTVTVSSVVLTATTSTAYQWIDCITLLPIFGATNQSFTATLSGNYAAVVTQNGCTDTTVCTPIFINCNSFYVTAYDTILNTFNLTVDTSVSNYALFYNWNFGDGFTSTLAAPSHIYAVDTVYNVCLQIHSITGDSCTYCHIIGKDYLGHIIKAGGFTLNVHNGSTGLNVPSTTLRVTDKLEIYPNPCGESLVIGHLSLGNTIKIYDVLGREQGISIVNLKSAIVNVSSLSSGVYFLKVTDKKGNSSFAKFVKE